MSQRTQNLTHPCSSRICYPVLPQKKHKVAFTKSEVNRDIRDKINMEEAFPPELPVKDTVGKLSVITPQTYARTHPTTPLLDQYEAPRIVVNPGPKTKLSPC